MASGHNENPQDDAPYRIPLASPDVGDEEVQAVREVLRSGTLTNGPATRRFEDRFAARHGVSRGVAFANGTAALAALYLGLGDRPGGRGQRRRR